MNVMNQKISDYWPNCHQRQLGLIKAKFGDLTVGLVLSHEVSEAEIVCIPGVGRGTLSSLRKAILKAMVEYLV